MDIFEIRTRLRILYPEGYKFIMREDGDVCILVPTYKTERYHPDWMLRLAFDTLVELVSYLEGMKV